MGATSSDVLFIDLGVREERVTGIERVHSCGSVAAMQIYGNKRKLLHKKSQTSMALVWDTNIVDIMSCEKALYKLCGCVLLL